ncbi:MAG: ribosomal protein S18-alanine N-acetyltransferase [Halobacteriota archaeon]
MTLPVGVVRTARPHDAVDVLEIERECFEESNEGLILEACGVTESFLVYDVGDGICGYVLGSIEDPGTARVTSLAVREECRRSGVASTLMDELVERFRRRDFDRVVLEVRVSNDGARSLYAGLGFGISAVKMEYYSDGEDAFLMEREL